ncbi:MAG TPA: Gfo/Idh/MocA family oxidoreductase, partial [Planctomycetota bacterium]|nr:Gfo/Idh/MocA family oxidoreductase [Planctomycetota bacterium]
MSASEPMGVAIVGSGMISEFQAKAIGALPDAYVAGFYDQVAELAKRRAEEFDARVYGSLEELLSDPRVHIVSICTPSGAHLEPA